MTTYGYIGLGSMGAAMAGHLIGTGAEVTVYDLQESAVAGAVRGGAKAAGSPAEVAAACDVLSICVPAAHHVDAVLTGDGGVAEGAHDGLSILVHSTVHPSSIRSANQVAAEWGVPLFDAAVAGGGERAATGDLLMLIGAGAEMPIDARVLCDVYAGTVVDGGPLGAGAGLKIAINVMTYAQFAAAATARDLLLEIGGSAETLYESWRSIGQLGELTGQFVSLLDLPDEFIDGLDDFLSTQVGISQKDLSLAMELGDARPGGQEFLASIHDLMPAVYRQAGSGSG